MGKFIDAVTNLGEVRKTEDAKTKKTLLEPYYFVSLNELIEEHSQAMTGKEYKTLLSSRREARKAGNDEEYFKLVSQAMQNDFKQDCMAASCIYEACAKLEIEEDLFIDSSNKYQKQKGEAYLKRISSKIDAEKTQEIFVFKKT
jgi:hypothetical protein